MFDAPLGRPVDHERCAKALGKFPSCDEVFETGTEAVRSGSDYEQMGRVLEFQCAGTAPLEKARYQDWNRRPVRPRSLRVRHREHLV